MIFIISLWRVKSSFQTFSLLFQNLSLFHPRNPAKKIVSKIPSIFHQPFFKIQFHGPSSKFSHPRVQSHPRIIIRWRSLNNFERPILYRCIHHEWPFTRILQLCNKRRVRERVRDKAKATSLSPYFPSPQDLQIRLSPFQTIDPLKRKFSKMSNKDKS